MPSIYSNCPLRSALVWNASWVHRSESIYGLACKLRTANSLRIDESLGYFTRETGQTPPAYQDWRRDSEETSTEDCYRSLRYCPICLRQAFHSIFHQYRSVRYCPFHAQDLIEFCPYCHELMNPYQGRPWHCSSCDFPLAEMPGFSWLAHFSAYPDGGSGEAWLRTEHFPSNRIDAEFAPSRVDADYWRRNIRRIGRWYFEELQYLMRGRFADHLHCALGPFVENRLGSTESRCLVAEALWDCANLIWGTGAALAWPSLNRRALSQLELHIFPRIFDRAKSAYLGDDAAELAVSEAVSLFFATALVRRLNREQQRFYQFNELDEQELWSAAAKNEEFCMSNPGVADFECGCPAETSIPECST